MQARSVATLLPSTLAVCCLFALTLPQPVAAQSAAQAGATISYQISAGTLESVLNKFATQSKLQVVYSPELVAGKRSGGVSGQQSPQKALKEILDGTGLTWDAVNESMFVLKRKERTIPSPRKGETPSTEPARSPKTAEVENGKVTSLAEVLVVGKKSLNADIERTEDDIQPYVVFSKEEIETSMASNVEEFLSRRLPMSQTKGTGAQDITSNRGNRSEFNLRGIGANQTLILVNGRRVAGVPNLSSSVIDQPDLNGIPISLIERIEVLPATASGIYGGSATGGVINVVLKSGYEGGSIRISYDNTFDSDSARKRISFTKGLSLEQGRTNILLSGSYSAANKLLDRDRPYLRLSRDLALENLGADAFTMDNMMRGNLANYATFPGENLVLRNGTDLGTSIGYIPSGYQGAGTDGGLGLAAGVGTFDLSIPNGAPGMRNSIISAPTTTSVHGTIRREFTDNLSMFLELEKTNNRSYLDYSNDTYGVTLDESDAGNPFNNTVSVLFNLNVPTNVTSVSDTGRITAGLVYKLKKSWAFSLDASKNSSENSYSRGLGTYDLWALQNAIRSGEIDIFRDLGTYPLDLSSYELNSRQSYGPSVGSTKEVTARFGGPIASLPAGAATLTTSIGTRKDWADGVRGSYSYFPARGQRVNSAYAELYLPVVSSGQEVPLISSLEAQLSLRHDRYMTTAVPVGSYIPFDPITGEIPPFDYVNSKVSSTDYTIGLRYTPFSGISIRGSIGTGFLPPSISQLGSATYQAGLYLSDPKRDGVRRLVSPVDFVSGGGGESLTPELSKSTSIGVIYTPDFAPWIRVSLDYTKIKKTDEITSLTSQQIVDLESSFPDRVGRGDNLPGDPAGWAGVINRVDVSSINIAKSDAEAFDLQIDIDKNLGRFGNLRLYSVLSRQTKLSSQILDSSPAVDRIGFMDGVLPVRGNVGIDWRFGSSLLSVNTQYFDDYLVYDSTYDQGTIDGAVSLQGNSRIPSQAYTDMNYRYVLKGGFFSGTSISIGIRNIFNKMPPIVASTTPYGGYSTFGDPRMRSYVISAEMNF